MNSKTNAPITDGGNRIFLSAREAYTSDGAQLVLLTTQNDIAGRLMNGVERFTIVLPMKLLDATQAGASGLKLKVYGTQAEVELEIPAWYLEGFLRVN